MPKPLIAVYHSWVGCSVSATAERHPEVFERIIYLTAFILRHRETGAKILRTRAKLGAFQAAKIDLLGGVAMPIAHLVKGAFYSHCNDEAIDAALCRLVDEPIRPYFSKIKATSHGLGHVKKSFIRCINDQVLPLPVQD